MILLALAASLSVADTERAFAQMAQDKGQWTAFRAYMAPDAIRLAPDVLPAARKLAGLADPPTAIQWQPALTITSCDGTLALSTGPWLLGQKSGRYYTIWQRQPDKRWKWLFDGGVGEKKLQAPPDTVEERRSACGTPPADDTPAAKVGGASTDRSLRWGLIRLPEPGKRLLRVRYVQAGRWINAVNVVLQ